MPFPPTSGKRFAPLEIKVQTEEVELTSEEAMEQPEPKELVDTQKG